MLAQVISLKYPTVSHWCFFCLFVCFFGGKRGWGGGVFVRKNMFNAIQLLITMCGVYC